MTITPDDLRRMMDTAYHPRRPALPRERVYLVSKRPATADEAEAADLDPTARSYFVEILEFSDGTSYTAVERQ